MISWGIIPNILGIIIIQERGIPINQPVQWNNKELWAQVLASSMSGLGDLGLSPQWDDLKLGGPDGHQVLSICARVSSLDNSLLLLGHFPICLAIHFCSVMWWESAQGFMSMRRWVSLSVMGYLQKYLLQRVEVCAGAGFMGEGIKACGFPLKWLMTCKRDGLVSTPTRPEKCG